MIIEPVVSSLCQAGLRADISRWSEPEPESGDTWGPEPEDGASQCQSEPGSEQRVEQTRSKLYTATPQPREHTEFWKFWTYLDIIRGR